MEFLILLFILPYFTSSSPTPNLSMDYYHKTWPNFNKIMEQVITQKQHQSPTTAAGVLRLFFHDCMINGCDASLLISSTAFAKSERDSDLEHSLPGDAFDLVTRSKTTLELQCPGIVSCSDILTVAARNLVVMLGGPHYNVLVGRKDGLVSKASDIEGHIPMANMSITQILSIFASEGFTTQEMVALTGAHTIGLSHCSQFTNRLYSFSKTSPHDPSMDPVLALAMEELCRNYTNDPAISGFLDIMTPGKFDNMYYQNLQKGLGLLASDQAMASDLRTKPFVDLYAANQTAFFEAFAMAMEKVSVHGIKTGNEGEVRRRCDAFNSYGNCCSRQIKTQKMQP